MKALTICQPYAELIARGEKRVENRTWPTTYRGPLAIHAGKSQEWLRFGDEKRLPAMAFGAIVAVADLAAVFHVTRLRPSDHTASHVRPLPLRFAFLLTDIHVIGPSCWVLENVRALARPIPCRGALGLWDVPAAMEREIAGIQEPRHADA